MNITASTHLKTQVVTYSSSNGNTLSLCPDCIARYESTAWPMDHRGASYSSISRGLHSSHCQECGAGLTHSEHDLLADNGVIAPRNNASRSIP